MVVGDKMVRVAESFYSGRRISVVDVTITRITKAGFVYTSRDLREKFKLGSDGLWHEYRPRSRGALQFRIWLEPKV